MLSLAMNINSKGWNKILYKGNKHAEEELLKNKKRVRDIYFENEFDYQKYLKVRYYPFSIKWKAYLTTLFRYKLTYRLKIQIRLFLGKIKRYLTQINWA